MYSICGYDYKPLVILVLLFLTILLIVLHTLACKDNNYYVAYLPNVPKEAKLTFYKTTLGYTRFSAYIEETQTIKGEKSIIRRYIPFRVIPLNNYNQQLDGVFIVKCTSFCKKSKDKKANKYKYSKFLNVYQPFIYNTKNKNHDFYNNYSFFENTDLDFESITQSLELKRKIFEERDKEMLSYIKSHL